MATYTSDDMVKAAWTQHKGGGSTCYKVGVYYEETPGEETVSRATLWANSPEDAEQIMVYNTLAGHADPTKIAESATESVRRVNVVTL